MILCFSLLYVAAIDVIGNLQSENSALCAIVDVIGKFLSKDSVLCAIVKIIETIQSVYDALYPTASLKTYHKHIAHYAP